MDRKEIELIDKHFEEVKKPEVAAMYTMATKAALLDARKQPTKETVIDEYRYIYTPVRKANENTYPSTTLYPGKKGNNFNILGILEVINRKTDETKTVYACLELFHTTAFTFWVDDNGRISSDEISDQYSRVLAELCPELNLRTPPVPKKAPVQQADAESLFRQMTSYNKRLLTYGTNDPELTETYDKITSIGQQILSSYPDFPYKSGTYTTLASSAFIMFQTEQSTSPSNEYLLKAKEHIEKAIAEDHRNQRALALSVAINLFTLNIREATKQLAKLSDSGFEEACISTGGFGLLRYTFFLPAQEDLETYKQNLYDYLNALCEKSKKNEYLLATSVAASAQLIYVVYTDAHTAYSLLNNYTKDLPENPAFFDLYTTYCMVCMTPYLNKTDEAVYYGKIAMKYTREQDKQKQANISSYYGLALAAQGNNNGIGFCKHATQIFPCDNTYFNCGRCLLMLGKAKEGIEWAWKALLVHEDDMNLMLLADLYHATGEDERALEYYLKAFKFIQRKDLLQTFTDENGKETLSVASTSALNYSLHTIFMNTISIYMKQQDYKNAIIHLQLADELVPDFPEWAIYKKTLPVIEYNQKELEEARNELLSVKAEAERQAQISQELVQKLIDLQDQFKKANMDKFKDWNLFEKEIDKIIEQLEAEASKNQQLMNSVKERFTRQFTNYSPDALHFLTTAEVLYEMHKNNEIDFACIVVEYCKVLEHQLRNVMGDQIPESMKMLGQIIGLIRGKKDSPYAKCLNQLNNVNELRKQSAHTGSLTKREAERIRSIYFDEGLLDFLN